MDDDKSAYVGPLQDKTFGGEPFAVVLGLVLLLFLSRVASESPAIPGVPAPLKVNAWNTLQVGAMAIFSILVLKMIVRRFPIPGIADAVEAV